MSYNKIKTELDALVPAEKKMVPIMKKISTIGEQFLVPPRRCLNLEFHISWTAVQKFDDC